MATKDDGNAEKSTEENVVFVADPGVVVGGVVHDGEKERRWSPFLEAVEKYPALTVHN